MRTRVETLNTLTSTIDNLLYSVKDGLHEEVLGELADIMYESGLASDIIVDILEKPNFSRYNGSEIAHSIKVNEGW